MKQILCNALLLCMLCAPPVHSASATVSPDDEDSLDEVIVEGTRGELSEMLQEMVKAEDAFFERYNELNTNDDFDMHCFRAAHIGTRLKSRYCIVNYMQKSLREHGQDYAAYLKQNFDASQGSTGGTTYKKGTDPPTSMGGPPVSAMVMMEVRRDEYQQNMREVVSRNPELIKMLRERYELAKRYEATRRKVWGLKPLVENDTTPATPAVP